MALPSYFRFREGDREVLDPSSFRLHDTLAAFHGAPRVFTSFAARRTTEHPTFRITGLSAHVTRLLRDAAAFNIGRQEHSRLEASEISEATLAALRSVYDGSGELELHVRLLASANGIECYCDTLALRWQAGSTVALRTVRAVRPFPEHKTTATEVCLAAQREAKNSGCPEALLLDDEGAILEGGWSSFFWFDSDGVLCTRQEGVLLGVTRALLLDSAEVRFGRCTPSDLRERGIGCFVANAVQGITPVSAIDGAAMQTADDAVQRLSSLLAAREERYTL